MYQNSWIHAHWYHNGSVWLWELSDSINPLKPAAFLALWSRRLSLTMEFEIHHSSAQGHSSRGKNPAIQWPSGVSQEVARLETIRTIPFFSFHCVYNRLFAVLSESDSTQNIRFSNVHSFLRCLAGGKLRISEQLGWCWNQWNLTLCRKCTTTAWYIFVIRKLLIPLTKFWYTGSVWQHSTVHSTARGRRERPPPIYFHHKYRQLLPPIQYHTVTDVFTKSKSSIREVLNPNPRSQNLVILSRIKNVRLSGLKFKILVNRINRCICNLDRINRYIFNLDRINRYICNLDRNNRCISNLDCINRCISNIDRINRCNANIDRINRCIANLASPI